MKNLEQQIKYAEAMGELNRKAKWDAATEYAKTLRDPIKKAFALEYACYKFGTGAEKFNWQGKLITDFAEIVLQVPNRIRKEVYKKINAI